MKYHDAIFVLHWKSVKVDRPRVFAICDVSGSVADYARAEGLSPADLRMPASTGEATR